MHDADLLLPLTSVLIVCLDLLLAACLFRRNSWLMLLFLGCKIYFSDLFVLLPFSSFNRSLSVSSNVFELYALLSIATSFVIFVAFCTPPIRYPGYFLGFSLPSIQIGSRRILSTVFLSCSLFFAILSLVYSIQYITLGIRCYPFCGDSAPQVWQSVGISYKFLFFYVLLAPRQYSSMFRSSNKLVIFVLLPLCFLAPLPLGSRIFSLAAIPIGLAFYFANVLPISRQLPHLSSHNHTSLVSNKSSYIFFTFIMFALLLSIGYFRSSNGEAFHPNLIVSILADLFTGEPLARIFQFQSALNAYENSSLSESLVYVARILFLYSPSSAHELIGLDLALKSEASLFGAFAFGGSFLAELYSVGGFFFAPVVIFLIAYVLRSADYSLRYFSRDPSFSIAVYIPATLFIIPLFRTPLYLQLDLLYTYVLQYISLLVALFLLKNPSSLIR
jgi:hypothetical protein